MLKEASPVIHHVPKVPTVSTRMAILGHTFPCVPVPPAAAQCLRHLRIHHLPDLFDPPDAQGRWKIRSTWIGKDAPDSGVDDGGRQELYEWITTGMVFPNGELCPEIVPYMTWEDTATADGWKNNEHLTEHLELGEPTLQQPTPMSPCELHDDFFGCPSHQACRDPMTLLFPIEERAGTRLDEHRRNKNIDRRSRT